MKVYKLCVKFYLHDGVEAEANLSSKDKIRLYRNASEMLSNLDVMFQRGLDEIFIARHTEAYYKGLYDMFYCEEDDGE